MIMKIYTDENGLPVYMEPVEEIDEETFQKLLSKKIIEKEDGSILELI